MPLDTFPRCNVDLTGSFGFEKTGSAESVLQSCMDVLVSQHFIGDPVEDVKYEEAQRKDGS